MLKLFGALTGAKTYIVAGATVLYGVVEWWSGAMTQDQALAFVFGGSGLAALRHGVAGSVIAIAEQLLPSVLKAVQQMQKPVAKGLIAEALLAGGLAACSPAQLKLAQDDIAGGIQAACADVLAAQKPNQASPVADYALAACGTATAVATLVQNSATIQWLGQLQQQLAAPAAAAPAKSA